MNHYLKDVLGQPQSIRKALDSFIRPDNLEKIIEIASLNPSKIIFVGMGSSHYCSYGASLYLNNKGFTSMVKSAGNFYYYECGLVDEKTLIILISQSGESAEIVNLVKTLPSSCKIVAITNYPTSTLGQRGDYTFSLNVEDEESVTTRTYLSSVMLVDLIAMSVVAGQARQEMSDELYGAVNSLESFLASYRDIETKIKQFFDNPLYLSLIGRGFSMSTVCAGTLFLREVVKYPAMDFDAGEFRHGPMEMVDEDFNGIIIAPSGQTFALNEKLALDIADKGGKVMFVSDQRIQASHKNILEINIGYVNEFLSPLTTIAPVQLLSNYLAERKGIDVGKFRWGSKVMTAE